ncbi:TPA: hypothetical protein P0P67_002661 [Staphylococcus aureus]|nr:hypothetical protein [Staphylococcus aureus]
MFNQQIRAYDKQKQYMIMPNDIELIELENGKIVSIYIGNEWITTNDDFDFMLSINERKDKNGRLIFENDYVKDSVGNISLVSNINGNFMLMYDTKKEYINNMFSTELEVIGNIYETQR